MICLFFIFEILAFTITGNFTAFLLCTILAITTVLLIPNAILFRNDLFWSINDGTLFVTEKLR